jgi:cardiolipin synthase A/B
MKFLPHTFKYSTKKIAIFFVVFVFFVGVYHAHKPIPEGTSFSGDVHFIADEEITFLYDLTYENNTGERVYEQQIFNQLFADIDNAKRFILLDMFLWSSQGESDYRDIGQGLADRLVARKKVVPDIDIVVVTDNFNTGYNSFTVPYFEEMKQAGIDVVFTNLRPLRDSNLLYSPLWRTFVGWWGDPPHGWLETPLFDKKSSFRSVATLFNFKANHRKVAVMDSDDTALSYILSSNPSGSGSEHSNAGIRVEGNFYKDVLRAEETIFRMSNFSAPWLETLLAEEDAVAEQAEEWEIKIRTQLLTERKIKEVVLSAINEAQHDDIIQIAMFYFSERDVVKALKGALDRGVVVRMVLDPSKTGFGRNKHGIPSRMVADELMQLHKKNLEVRYYDTEEEQFHTKLFTMRSGEWLIVITGSANYTRRNLDNLNLEANILVKTPLDSMFAEDVQNYFDRIWSNEGGDIYTTDYNSYPKSSFVRKLQYRTQEATGAGTF